MKVLGLIPARGGSKSIPGKNLVRIAGRSLIEHTYAGAKASGRLDRVILSTDDASIAAEGRRLGIEVPFLRPPELAADDTPMIDVVLHALGALAPYAPDAVLLLQPTSPLRRARHIDQALALLEGHDAVASVVPVPKHLCPHYLMRLAGDGLLEPFLPDGPRYTRRQDVPAAYSRDGTIFLTRTHVLTSSKSFYGARCAALVIDTSESVNIDDPEDLERAERLILVT